MGWDDQLYMHYFSPNTIFVSAAATPKSGSEIRAWDVPQDFWGFYFKDANDAEVFMASLPPELREYVTLIDQGYSRVKPLLDELRTNAGRMLAGSLAAWLVSVCVFLYLNVYLQKRNMGILRGLGVPARSVFSMCLAACLCLWLLAAGIGTAFGAVLYGGFEARAYDAVFAKDGYNRAYSDVAAGTAQSYDPAEENWDDIVKRAMGASRGPDAGVILLTLAGQCIVFTGVCAAVTGAVSRKSIGRLLRGVNLELSV
jgi:hypothetical protein